MGKKKGLDHWILDQVWLVPAWLTSLGEVIALELHFPCQQTGDGNICVVVLLWVVNKIPGMRSKFS